MQRPARDLHRFSLMTTCGLFALLLAGLCCAGSASAQTPGVVRWPGTEVLDKPQINGGRLMTLKAEQQVEILERGFFWWHVRAQGKTGWTPGVMIETAVASAPASAVTPAAAPALPAAPSANATDGAPGASAAPTPGSEPPPAQAVQPDGRALIVGVSNYGSSRVENLPGVDRDMFSARNMAAAMGVAADRMTVLRDAAATTAGIEKALETLAEQTVPGAPVLVYFSGHGTSYAVPGPEGACAQALVTYAQGTLEGSRLSELLRRVADKTDRLFVFIDSCFSGGLMRTRSVDARIRAKFSARPDSSNCARVVNLLRPASTRSTARFTAVMAARDNEYALEVENQGGLATVNFMRCLGAADGASRSIADLRNCAQQGIQTGLAGSDVYLPQNMTVFGDDASRPFPVASVVKAPRDLLARLGNILLSRGAGVEVDAATFAQTLLSHRDPAWTLRVAAPASLRIGRDKLALTLTSPRPGYVYVWSVDAGGTASLLFPNRIDVAHRIAAGQPMQLPRPSWPMVSGGPAGTTRLLVLVSDAPRALPLPATSAQDAEPVFVSYAPGRLPVALADHFSAGATRQGDLCFDARAASCQGRYAFTQVDVREVAP